MANNFKSELDAGKERTATVFTSGGANTVGITVVIDAVKCGEVGEAIRLLDKIKHQIQQAPWPPVALA
jgi:hypothetical protein